MKRLGSIQAAVYRSVRKQWYYRQWISENNISNVLYTKQRGMKNGESRKCEM